MNKAAIAAGVVLVLLIAGLFVARSQVAAYYRTPEFQAEIAGLVGGTPRVTPRGWFDFTVVGKGLKLDVDVDAVPRILTQKVGLKLRGSYGSGAVKAAFVLPLVVLLDGPPADWDGPVGEGSLSEFDVCPWLGAKESGPRCVSGKGSVSMTSPPLAASVKIGATNWRVEQPIKATLTTKPFEAELAMEGKNLVLRKPVTLATSVGTATISGKILGIHGAAPEIALEVAARGMIARVAVATLLQCRGIPAKDTFTVRGRPAALRCQ